MSKEVINLNAIFNNKLILNRLGLYLYDYSKRAYRYNTVTLVCTGCGRSVLRRSADNLFGGMWYSCRRCGIDGDSIDLAAHIWDMPRIEAGWKLIKKDDNFKHLKIKKSDVELYIQHYSDKFRLASKFFSSCSGTPYDNEKFSDLVDLLDLRSRITDPGLWLERIGWMFKLREVDEKLEEESSEVFLYPITRDKWRDAVILIPFEDIPGRYCGALVIGRLAVTNKLSMKYYPAHPIRKIKLLRSRDRKSYKRSLLDTGMCLVKGAVHYFRTKTPSFMLMNPLVAIRMNIRCMRDPGPALPLMGLYCNDRAAPFVSWRALRGGAEEKRRVVICAPSDNPKKMDIARRLAVDITGWHTSSDFTNYKDKPMMWLNSLSDNAVLTGRAGKRPFYHIY